MEQYYVLKYSKNGGLHCVNERHIGDVDWAKSLNHLLLNERQCMTKDKRVALTGFYLFLPTT